MTNPLLRPQDKKTYSILSPKATHWRKASCEEVECEGLQHGWMMLIDERTELGQKQAYYIRKLSGRKFTEETCEGLTSFTFEAGQTCFTEHEVPLDRPELYVVRRGDLEHDLGEKKVHANGENWADDFATHQQQIADAIEKG